MSEQLPLDVIDAIFDQLPDEKSTLKDFSLVCKAWIYPSRRRLFAVVQINNRNADEFKNALVSSSKTSPISPHVRRLRLIGSFSQEFWNQTFPHLRALENVHSLVIMGYYEQFRHDSPGTVFNGFNTITRLHLDAIEFATFAQVAQLISALSHLETLIITGCTWSVSDPPDLTVSPPQTLRALDMFDCNWLAILQWLRSLDHVPALHTLYVRGSYRYPSDTLASFLQELGPHLKELWLDPDAIQGGLTSINSLHNPYLRSFTAHSQYKKISQQLSHLLSHVASSELEEIVIGLPSVYGNLNATDWTHLDATLSQQPQFSKLRSFRICTESDRSAWLVDHLPRSHARNILCIQPFQWEATKL